jgi:energy-coupling factor transport system permease protein
MVHRRATLSLVIATLSPVMTATRPRLHALCWLVWALSAAVCVLMARSAVYVVIVVLVAALCVELHGLRNAISRAFPVFLALAVVFAVARVVLDALTGHVDGNHTWFTTPSAHLPDIFGGLQIGGAVQREVVLASCADAIVVIAIIAIFGAWNAVVSHHELLQLIPRAFRDLGLVIAIALSFVPSTVDAVRSAREADRARAGRVRRGRVARTFVAVLHTGLDRAIALAESLDSRGFGHRAATDAAERIAVALLAVALLALGATGAALVSRADVAATVSLAVAAAAIAGAVAAGSRAALRTRYRPRPFRRIDMTIAVLAAAAPLAVAISADLTDAALTWVPRRLELPEFHPAIAASLALLLAPALALRDPSR